MKTRLSAFVIAAATAATLAVAVPTTPAKASSGWAIAAGVAGGLVLGSLAVNSAYGYPNYPYYGPRYGYAYYGGYNGGWGGPAYPAWRPYAGYGGYGGYASYGYAGYYGAPAYATYGYGSS